MRRRWLPLALIILCLAGHRPANAQTFPTDDPALQRIWEEGMNRSRAYRLGQTLMDSLGPRLTGSPGQAAAQEWLRLTYAGWGIEARNERYGTWKGWRRGVTHVDLVEPRTRTLNASLLAWSPGTAGPVRGSVILIPEIADSAAFQSWLPQARGRFVLSSFPQPTCRPDGDWRGNATPESFAAMSEARDRAREAWESNLKRTGLSEEELAAALEDAGAAGLLTSSWPPGWGVMRVFSADTEEIPSLALSCEDYGLLARLAAHGQGPVIEVEADAEDMGSVPVFNTIAEIRGTERPDEYVVLSAHFDSWDAASGATDNGTGTVTVAEAMRILQQTYPNPKRTILAGHWNGEEQGLNGSRAFAADHPEVVRGLQVLLNQDNGTGRISRISMQGLLEAGERFADWLSRVPQEIGGHIELSMPGMPGGGGSDYASFLCAGAPAFFLIAHNWSYFPYTWHTNIDTFDKVVLDDLRNNATLFAMLAYLASEDSLRVPRTQRALPLDEETGEPRQWPQCRDAERSWEEQRR